MSHLSAQISDFNLVGQLVGFVIKDGDRIKYLRVAVSEREYWIKVPKEMRDRLDRDLMPGCWVAITGTRKLDWKKGIVKLTAAEVQLTTKPSDGLTMLVSPSAPPPPAQGKASILVCQKSSCCQRGSKAVCRALEESLHDRGLTDRVEIKTTGCLKQCKQGPNLVVMPDKSRYSNFQPQQIDELLATHFGASQLVAVNDSRGEGGF